MTNTDANITLKKGVKIGDFKAVKEGLWLERTDFDVTFEQYEENAMVLVLNNATLKLTVNLSREVIGELKKRIKGGD